MNARQDRARRFLRIVEEVDRLAQGAPNIDGPTQGELITEALLMIWNRLDDLEQAEA